MKMCMILMHEYGVCKSLFHVGELMSIYAAFAFGNHRNRMPNFLFSDLVQYDQCCTLRTGAMNYQEIYLLFLKTHHMTVRGTIVLNQGFCSLLLQFPEITNGVLLLQTWIYYEQGDLEKIIDSSLGDDLDVAQACRFLEIGLLCTQDVTRHRPDMSKVIAMLTGETDVESANISKPAIISDFMDLKVRSMRKPIEIAASSTFLSSLNAHSSPMLSNETTETSMISTVSDRE